MALAPWPPRRSMRRRRTNAGAARPALGFVYFTDHYAGAAEALLEALQQRWPGVAWVGCVGVGVAACGVEYIDEPALVLMLAPLPAAASRSSPARARCRASSRWHSALVHADPATPDLAELIGEMSGRTDTGYLFGGLASSRTGGRAHRRRRLARRAVGRGLRAVGGAGLARDPGLPAGRAQRASRRPSATSCSNSTAAGAGLPAADLGITPRRPAPGAAPPARHAGRADRRRATPRSSAGGGSSAPTPGAPPARPRPRPQAVAVADDGGARHAAGVLHPRRRRRAARPGAHLQRDPRRARPGRRHARAHGRIAGAVYVSCAGRGGPHFGGDSAELQIVRHALGEVPLVGFFAAGEIARHHLYGYTGVLTVFTEPG
jgi:hypothetical protein